MKLLFLDESGDHNLSKIDPLYPVFVLGGVIIEQYYLEAVIQPQLESFKHAFFSKDTVLHTSDMTRNRAGFERMKDVAFRLEVYESLNTLMRTWDYQIIACAIRKDEHLSRYGAAALDPYLLSLDVVVEQFCHALGDKEAAGTLIVEARGHPLDRQLELAWINLKVQGTEHLRASEVTKRVSGLSIRNKKDNLPGLQLADLVVTPLGRYVLGKPVKEDFIIVEEKLRRYEGTYKDVGLTVLPK